MIIYEEQYVVAWCPFCDQGWVVIAKEKNSKELFVYCLECLLEWKNPVDIKIGDTQSILFYGDREPPKYEEIVAKGWDKFILEDYP